MRRRFILVSTILLATCVSALGDSYPSKPIRAIIPFVL